MRTIKKFLLLFASVGFLGIAVAASYPNAGNGTEPNVWTRNFSGVLKAAQTTGYPIFLIAVNSPVCGHCHLMMDNTVNTEEFAAMERELTFYKVIMDQAYSSSSPDWSYMLSLYFPQYFDYQMYPLVAVLRKDGRVYGSFGNATTDGRGVAGDVRVLIENLAAEQIDGVIPPAPAKTSGEWLSELKGKSFGVLFDEGKNIAGSLELNLTANGKVRSRVYLPSGRANVNATMSLADDVPAIEGGGMSLAYNATTKTWKGLYGNYKAIIASASSNLDGLYTCGLDNGANGYGYGVATVKNGKVKIGGKISGLTRLNAKGTLVVLPRAAFVDEMPNLSIAGADSVGFAALTKGNYVIGGLGVASNGRSFLNLNANGAWSGDGNRWNPSENLSGLSGKTFSVADSSGDVSFTLAFVKGNKLSAQADGYQARFSAQVKKGTFKGNMRSFSGGNRINVRYEGVFVGSGAAIDLVGVTSVGLPVTSKTGDCQTCTIVPF